MAIIKCSECGKEKSDKVKKCPHCGYKEKREINKKILIYGGLIFSVILIGILLLLIMKREKPLNDNEKMAVACIKDYKEMLKNPDSLQVHDIRMQDNREKDENDAIEFFIDTSGQNGFGGNTRNIIRYVYHTDDGKVYYTGSDDDKDDDNFIYQIAADIIEEDYPKLLKDDGAKISVERVMSEINN